MNRRVFWPLIARLTGRGPGSAYLPWRRRPAAPGYRRKSAKAALAAELFAGLIFFGEKGRADIPIQLDAMIGQMMVEESCNGAVLCGDGGKSRGILHIQSSFWADVSKWRAARRLPTRSYAWVMDPAWSREYARSGIAMLEEKLRAIGVQPSAGNIYAAWNLGFAAFKKRGFDLRRCPRRTRAAAWAIETAIWNAYLSRRFNELAAAGARLAATTPGGH